MQIIRIGIIGIGWISQKTYLPILSNIDNIKIDSIFDIDHNKAEKCAREFNIPHFTSIEDIFFSQELDAVIINTPNYTHGKYALQALQNKMHVLCEKPTVISLTDYQKIKLEAEKQNCLFIPAFVNRYRSDILKLFEMIDNNMIGNIEHIDAGWVRRSGYPRPGSWFTNKKFSGGGVLIDLGPHVLDICLHLLDNSNINEVENISWYENQVKNLNSDYAAQWYDQGKVENLKMDVESTCFGKVICDGGKSLALSLSWNAPVDNDFTYFTIYGDKGAIQLRTLFGFSLNRSWEFNELILKGKNIKSKKIVFKGVEEQQMQSFERLCRFFINCLKDKKYLNKILLSGEQTVQAIEKLYSNEIQSQVLFKKEDFEFEQF